MFFSARIAALSVCARPLAVSLSLALLSPVAALADSSRRSGCTGEV